MNVTDKHDCKVIRKFQVGSFFVKIPDKWQILPSLTEGSEDYPGAWRN